MLSYEWLTSLETYNRLKEKAHPSVSVMALASEGEPYVFQGHYGRVPEGKVYVKLVGPQEAIDQTWRDYYAKD